MIKRISFASKAVGVSFALFADEWPEAVAIAGRAADGVRPCRTVACTALAELSEPMPKHDGVDIGWFTDADHLDRFERWIHSADGQQSGRRREQLTVVGSTASVVADEIVLRGESWLEQRWLDGGPRLKQIALALRAPGLSAADFSQRWRGHSGTLTTGTADRPAVAIPDAVKGQAYVQNHPVLTSVQPAVYDAVNEVYFDELGDLMKRVEWFHDAVNSVPAGDDLFGQSWFLAVREHLVAS